MKSQIAQMIRARKAGARAGLEEKFQQGELFSENEPRQSTTVVEQKTFFKEKKMELKWIEKLGAGERIFFQSSRLIYHIKQKQAVMFILQQDSELDARIVYTLGIGPCVGLLLLGSRHTEDDSRAFLFAHLDSDFDAPGVAQNFYDKVREKLSSIDTAILITSQSSRWLTIAANLVELNKSIPVDQFTDRVKIHYHTVDVDCIVNLKEPHRPFNFEINNFVELTQQEFLETINIVDHEKNSDFENFSEYTSRLPMNAQ